MFIGARHCPHCGAAAVEAGPATLSVLKCPRCDVDMASIAIASEKLRECARCDGLWLEVAAFENICSNREEQSAVLGGATVAPAHPLTNNEAKVRYVPCPECRQLMNRINFAHCSGVIVDVCKGHGTWFDRDELSQIIQFIRAGGLGVAREKEKREIQYEREQLRAEQLAAAKRANSLGYYSSDEDRLSGLSAAGGLLKLLIG